MKFLQLFNHRRASTQRPCSRPVALLHALCGQCLDVLEINLLRPCRLGRQRFRTLTTDAAAKIRVVVVNRSAVSATASVHELYPRCAGRFDVRRDAALR